MTTPTHFVAIVPGAVDILGEKHGLSFNARALLLWLCTTADRTTGEWSPATVGRITEAMRLSRKAARRGLGELKDAGLVKLDLPQGHDGKVIVRCHDEIVLPFDPRSRRSHGRSRQSSTRSRRSFNGSRQSTHANRENADYRQQQVVNDETAPDGLGRRSERPPISECPTCRGDGLVINDDDRLAYPCTTCRGAA